MENTAKVINDIQPDIQEIRQKQLENTIAFIHSDAKKEDKLLEDSRVEAGGE